MDDSKLKKKEKLALLFILKDEGKTIGKAIRAFHLNNKPIYDRLIVAIDNSTKDNTYEEVKKYTDEISYFDWKENFSIHRNDLIKKVPKDFFICFPDGHEVLRPKGLLCLVDFMDEPPAQRTKDLPNAPNIFSPWIEIDVDEFDVPAVIFRRPIIFRNTGQVEFRRGVHNYLYDEDKHIICAMPEVSFIHNMPFKRKEMRTGMRQDMNKRKLTQTVKKSPNDTRDNFYLAETFEESGDPKKAFKYYKRTFDLCDGKDNDMAAQSCISLMSSCINNKDWTTAIPWAYKGMRNNWERAELYYYLGLCLSQLKRYGEAIHWYIITASMKIPHKSSYFIQGKVYTWLPYDGIAYCKNKLGDTEGALEASEKILQWKTNKTTGEPCPIIMRNINTLKDAIKNKDKDLKAQELLQDSGLYDTALGQLDKGVKEDLNESKLQMEVV